MLEMLKSRYKPDDLPWVPTGLPRNRRVDGWDRYHLIVPSLPGFAYSSKPGTEDDFKASTIAYLFNQLMTGLGFESYAAQGGDIGSTVSCDLALTYPSCKGMSCSLSISSNEPLINHDKASLCLPPYMIRR